MRRRNQRPRRDTWAVEERHDGVWATRQLATGWRVEQRVVIQGATPVIAETRVRPTGGGSVPAGGVDVALLRRVTVGGARDAAAKRLRPKPGDGDLRAFEALDPSARRRGEARRWRLALTALAYARAVAAGSAHPNQDAATAMGIDARVVRDRLHAARRHEPALLAGGGRQGVIGDARLTEAGQQAIQDRFDRVNASLGFGAGIGPIFASGSLGELDVSMASSLGAAERTVPGLWEMSLDDIRCRSPLGRRGWTELPAGMALRTDAHGTEVIDTVTGEPIP